MSNLNEYRQKEKFVKRLINIESRVKDIVIDDGKRVTESRQKHHAIKDYNKKFMQQGNTHQY